MDSCWMIISIPGLVNHHQPECVRAVWWESHAYQLGLLGSATASGWVWIAFVFVSPPPRTSFYDMHLSSSTGNRDSSLLYPRLYTCSHYHKTQRHNMLAAATQRVNDDDLDVSTSIRYYSPPPLSFKQVIIISAKGTSFRFKRIAVHLLPTND